MPRELPDTTDWITDRLAGLGERIRDTRIDQGLTQEAVYLAAGVDRRTFQAVEAGQANPTTTTLLRIAYVLDIPPGDLFR
ncbi:helix-turn-helix transcriptional regulator [Streptomyces sp. bgisy153]|uniref:helix-turn-helix transcriptional regulator n=1 Tax=Streptomyces sp. bgisy153 TaxID=3413793 RepID=UPI003D74CDB6